MRRGSRWQEFGTISWEQRKWRDQLKGGRPRARLAMGHASETRVITK